MAAAHQQTVLKLIPDLKSKNEEVRTKAAKALFDFVSSDLREVSPEELGAVLDLITKQMLDNVKGDAAAKSGGILTIVVLINALDLIDICKTDARISRFGNFLCQTCLASSTEPAVIELAAKALARLTQVSGTYTVNLMNQLVTHEFKRAIENLQEPLLGPQTSQNPEFLRSETKRYAAVLVLREIAVCMPTFFFQHVSQFFDVIFNPIWDTKPVLRESAVHALRAGLIVTVQRETAKQSKHQHIAWYKTCYNAVRAGFNQVKKKAKLSLKSKKLFSRKLVIGTVKPV